MTILEVVRFELVLETAGGVTRPGSGAEGEADAVLETDPSGRLRIPGTSLAGALRARFSELSHVDSTALERAANLFGDVRREWRNGKLETVSVASALWVMDAVQTPAGDSTQIRWTTAIDRERAAARNHTLRGTEMATTGTRFVARVWTMGPDLGIASTFKTMLDSWQPSIGRGASSGHGRARIEGFITGKVSLADFGWLTKWLTLSGPDLIDEVVTSGHTDPVSADPTMAQEPSTRSTLNLICHLAGPVLVASPARTHPNDRAIGSRTPLREHGQPLIPATTIKGVIRSRSEFILRSVGLDACYNQQCGNCPTCDWFGHGGGEDLRTSSVGQRARVFFQDALVRNSISRTRTHIAIDRFTGGVAQRSPTDALIHVPGSRGGQLYSIEAPEQGDFTVGLSWPADLPRLELFKAVLRLVLEDLNDGLVGIGAGTTRGYGTVTIDKADQLLSLRDARNLLKSRVTQVVEDDTRQEDRP